MSTKNNKTHARSQYETTSFAGSFERVPNLLRAYPAKIS